jgi:large subunit ribosomal protein L5
MAKQLTAINQSRLKTFYLETVAPQLLKEFKLSNNMAAPKITKIVVNMGVTQPLELGAREKAIANVVKQFEIITGQHPQITKAKKAIAGFKLRANDPVGVSVTLRGERMWSFLDRLISITLPRVKDFRGISRVSFDGRGNYSLGLEEQIVFPEISYDTIESVRGLQINFTITNATNQSSFRMLELLGMPFAKEEAAK